jgi:hypothetical protein
MIFPSIKPSKITVIAKKHEEKSTNQLPWKVQDLWNYAYQTNLTGHYPINNQQKSNLSESIQKVFEFKISPNKFVHG